MSSGDFELPSSIQNTSFGAGKIAPLATTIIPWVDLDHHPVAESILIPVVIVIFVANLFVISSVAVLVCKHNQWTTNPLPCRKLKPGHIFVLNLASADILVGAASLALFLLDEFQYQPNSIEVCCTRFAFFISPCIASVMSMFAIACDRYLTIMHPLQYMMKIKVWKTGLASFIIWLIALLIGFAPLMGWNQSSSSSFEPCTFNSIVPPSYILFISFGIFFTILLLTFILYFKVYRVSRRHARRIADTESSFAESYMKQSTFSLNLKVNNSGGHGNMRTTISDNNLHASEATQASPNSKTQRSKSLLHTHAMVIKTIKTSKSMTDLPTSNDNIAARRRGSSFGDFLTNMWHRLQFHESSLQSLNRKRRKKKAFRTLALVMGFFFCMWSPFLITCVVQVFCGSSCQIPVNLTIYLLLLGIANSAVNPLVYTYTNRDIRKYFCQCYCGCLATTETFGSSTDNLPSRLNKINEAHVRELPLPLEAKCYSYVTPIITRRNTVFENAIISASDHHVKTDEITV